MTLDRNVTLRCVAEDLIAGWEEPDQLRAVKTIRGQITEHLAGGLPQSKIARTIKQVPRLNKLSHPLLRHFEATYSQGFSATTAESISGLSAPHWWKQKTQQWRGAATNHSIIYDKYPTLGDETMWLCAAGLRRDGDRSDFYKKFMADVRRQGPETFLPSGEDFTYHEIDEKCSVFDSWKLQLHCGTLILLSESLVRKGATKSFEIVKVSRFDDRHVIGKLELSVEIVHVDNKALYEAFLVARVQDRAFIKEVDVACQIARAALQRSAEEWSPTPFGEDSFAFSALIEPEALAASKELAETGTLSEDSHPGELRLGIRAHYTHKDGIVDAEVDGYAVQSLCGHWFVPTRNPENLEVCADCQTTLDGFAD